jgi:dienelactone hydrolase
MALYQEPREVGTAHRQVIRTQLEAVVRAARERARVRRRSAFQPDWASPAAYARSAEDARRRFVEMLGWPLTEPRGRAPEMREEFVAEDDLGRISRVWVRVLPELEAYGLLFVPRGPGPHPLVISQHGGGGTPELCSNFFGSANYNDMSRRALRRGAAVFAPQLPMWQEQFGPKPERDMFDRQLRQVGGSIAALDVFQIACCLDALGGRADIDSGRIGMMGLSWGGFYTLVAAAVDTRIRAALTSCFFNDRETYDLGPAVWFDSAGAFMDAEIAALVAPRALCIEVGQRDDMFAVDRARAEAEPVRAVYERLGLGERFRYHEHAGTHEFDLEDGGLEFLMRWLMG